jgi:hypothetical protein
MITLLSIPGQAVSTAAKDLQKAPFCQSHTTREIRPQTHGDQFSAKFGKGEYFHPFQGKSIILVYS